MKRKRNKITGYDPQKLGEFIQKSCESKTRYATEEEAEFNADIRYIGYYHCIYCDGWHLTSRKEES